MRILVLSNLYPPNVIGGYERLCFEVTAGLAELGHEMVVLTSRYDGQPADYSRQTVYRTLDLVTGPDIYTPFAGTPDQREEINRRNLQTLAETLERTRPDVVFAWNLFFLDASILHALEASPVRTVVMLTDNWLLVMRNPVFVSEFFRKFVHGSGNFSPQSSWRRRLAALKEIFGRAGPRRNRSSLEAIFGAAFMHDLYEAGGVTFNRYRIIHNGVRQVQRDQAAFRDCARWVEPDTLRLLFAGRLVDLKGAHTAVAAMPLLEPASCGVTRVQLTILGDAQDAAYQQQLAAAIAQSGRSSDIVLRPTVAEHELFELFQANDIYLFPSLYEPFSLTLIHALACGIPTVASRVGGNPEIVQDGRSGLLFDKGDPQDLADAVRRLARDPSLRVRLSQGGRAAAAGFTFERMVTEMTRFLMPRA